jgi:DNA-binding NarL/FixJ family response regulator
MKTKSINKPLIQIALIESDPLRLAGFRALLASEQDFELTLVSLPEFGASENTNIDVVLLGNCSDQKLVAVTATLKAIRPEVRIVVTGSGTGDETILRALACGAKGYIDEAASSGDFVQAIRLVNQGLVWAPLGVLSMFIERASSGSLRSFAAGRPDFTSREKEILEMLVAGRSNKEIAEPLGIEERAVKTHVSRLMRKVGVHTRIMLSVHAITHSLVFAKPTTT